MIPGSGIVAENTGTSWDVHLLQKFDRPTVGRRVNEGCSAKRSSSPAIRGWGRRHYTYLPMEIASNSANSCASLLINAARFARGCALSNALRLLQLGNALRAASTARSTSSSIASWTSHIFSSVAGLYTGNVLPLPLGTNYARWLVLLVYGFQSFFLSCGRDIYLIVDEQTSLRLFRRHYVS